MITGRVRQEITKEAILNLISEYDIYRALLGEFKLNRTFCNVLRGESTPSIIVRDIGGKLYHKDYGCYFYRGDCISLVQQAKGYNYKQALEWIDSMFCLGFCLSDTGSKYPQPAFNGIITWEQPKREIIPPPLLQIVTRKWQKSELSYWNEYHQDISDLKRENIYVPKIIYRNRQKLPIKKDELVFCYWYPEEESWKLYRPLVGKRMKNTPVYEWKWDTNLSYQYVEYLSSLSNCNVAIVTKSKKDRMVLMKALEIDCICNVQAENPATFSDETLEHIKNNSKRQVICSDSDNAGKEFSWWLTKEHNYQHCNTPEKYKQEDIKDFAGLARGYGLEVVRQHFIDKGIL